MSFTINNNDEVYSGAVSEAKEYTDKKYQHTMTVIYAVLIVVVLVFVQIIIDSFRFSSVTYKEYENRMEERNVLLTENKETINEILNNQKKIINKLQELQAGNSVKSDENKKRMMQIKE